MTNMNNMKQLKKISSIPGVGMLTALSVVALTGDGKQFSNTRHFAAYLGLVPRQHSSGGHEKCWVSVKEAILLFALYSFMVLEQ